MKIRFLSLLCLNVICIACSSTQDPGNKLESENYHDKNISSQISRIKASFKEGDTKTACSLNLSLSNKITSYDDISVSLLKDLNEVQIKCGVRSLTVDLNKE